MKWHAGVVAALVFAPAVATAQAKPDKQQAPQPQIVKDKPQGQQYAKGQDHWSASHATKEMLVKHGYKVVGAEQFEDGNVLYFRRGDATRASDVQVEKAVIRKGASGVEFDGVPRAVLADVKAKLRM